MPIRVCERCYYNNVLPRHWCGDCDKKGWDKMSFKYHCINHPDRGAVGTLDGKLLCRECWDATLRKWRKRQPQKTLEEFGVKKGVKGNEIAAR